MQSWAEWIVFLQKYFKFLHDRQGAAKEGVRTADESKKQHDEDSKEIISLEDSWGLKRLSLQAYLVEMNIHHVP